MKFKQKIQSVIYLTADVQVPAESETIWKNKTVVG